MMTGTVVVTDLDGTLLHPETYSFEAALPALGFLKERGVPLVLCSSKTRWEIESYRERLENDDPFVAENGVGIFVPEDYFPFPVEGESTDSYIVMTLGRPYAEIRGVFEALRKRLKVRVRGFADMTVQEVASLSGLKPEEAELSLKRDFGEPFVFEEGETGVEAFLKAIEEAGLHWTRGRFYHMLGDNDKGRAVRILRGLYEKLFGGVRTVGLGDNLNDLPLLKEVDTAVLVQKADGSYEPEINIPGLIRAVGIGPEGWNRAILELGGTF